MSNMLDCADDARVAFPLFQAEYGGSSPTSALELRIEKITPKLACKLNAVWHSRLPVITYNNIIGTGMHFCFGAEYKNQYYAVAIWSAPIARLLNDRKTLELRRFAISPDAPKNTATRMLAVMRRMLMKRMPHIKRLISYQDTQVHSGTIYRAAGWNPKKRPNGSGKGWGSGWQSRVRNKEQTTADKIRWEYQL